MKFTKSLVILTILILLLLGGWYVLQSQEFISGTTEDTQEIMSGNSDVPSKNILEVATDTGASIEAIPENAGEVIDTGDSINTADLLPAASGQSLIITYQDDETGETKTKELFIPRLHNPLILDEEYGPIEVNGTIYERGKKRVSFYSLGSAGVDSRDERIHKGLDSKSCMLEITENSMENAEKVESYCLNYSFNKYKKLSSTSLKLEDEGLLNKEIELCGTWEHGDYKRYNTKEFKSQLSGWNNDEIIIFNGNKEKNIEQQSPYMFKIYPYNISGKQLKFLVSDVLLKEGGELWNKEFVTFFGSTRVTFNLVGGIRLGEPDVLIETEETNEKGQKVKILNPKLAEIGCPDILDVIIK